MKDKVKKYKSHSQGRIILEVEDCNGSTYSIYDKIRIFEKSSSNYGKVYKIIGFRWNIDHTRICAITTSHNYGIRLDWIEHYVEIKKEPEFVLPKKWCIKWGNKQNCEIIQSYLNQLNNNRWCYTVEDTHKHAVVDYENIYYGSKTDMYSFLKRNSHLTEITFEQFKQYVLFDGYKVGDKINTFGATNAVITRLQYINGQSVAFFKLKNGLSGSWTRVLIKNIIK